jgi:hypothetical protein
VGAYRQVTEHGCFTTVLADTVVHWLREQYACGTESGLEFEYDAALKSIFDPLVAYVNRSWRVPSADAGGCPRPGGGSLE